MKKAAFFTLGCKVNYYDTESLKGLFEEAGYEITGFTDEAHVYVINTCTVTHLSDSKSRQLIRQARKRSPEAIVVATGCYAQVSPEEVEKIPGIDIITGTKDRLELPRLVEERQKGKTYVNVSPFEDSSPYERITFNANRSRRRAFLKVQEGCRQQCSYCIVPIARGLSRSTPLEHVMREIDLIERSGFKEIVLTGIRLGQYEDKKEEISLGGLIKEIEKRKKISRIRLSSLEPSDMTGELIDTICNSEKVCRNLHIPLQSGSDKLLKAMNRPYNTEEYSFVVGVLRQKMPDISIGTDIITGFPGETSVHHQQTLSFIEEMEFSRLHVFRYSPRPGTPAANMENQVNPAFKETRWQEISALGKKLAYNFRLKFENKREKILVEKADPERKYVEGFTDHYLRLRATTETDPKSLLGEIVLADISSVSEDDELMHGFCIPNL